ncbi:MAG TPA: serine/threonine-protein kinase [Kofleriaceae bacterium]|jgi:tetratricopeptide (TPR) repeat protein
MAGPPELDTTLEAAAGDRVPGGRAFDRGFTIGHFRVVRELGRGGMGVVYEAFDPDLERKVAIKVVHDRDASSAAGARLLREAQAMARLAHPHVVAVHEVGTVAGQVFLVMELVAGDTLGKWLKAAPRSWREIAGALVQAGEGLAAAHAAGLVHRDFKPSNVLVDDGGRVRVGDFGLADGGLAHGSDRVAGTPGYMAPEQDAGDAVDARADQYAFAVTLREALQYVAKVPRRVRTAIARALEEQPRDRFADMDELLDELRRALSTRRRVAIAVAGAALASAVLAATVATAARPAAGACDDNLVDRVWSGSASLPPAFAAHAAESATTARLVDDWAASWKLGRAAACKADARDARVACLDRELAELHAQLAIWADGDRGVIAHAVAAASALPDPAMCSDHVVSPAVALPLVAELAELAALEHSGKSARGRALVKTVVAQAEATGDPHTIASALLAAGRIERDVGELDAARADLARAAEQASRAGDNDQLADALTIGAVVAGDQGRPLDGLGLVDAARAIANNPNRRAVIELVRGEALRDAGRLPEAIDELGAVVRTLEARRDPGARVRLAAALAGLADAYIDHREWARAVELHQRAAKIEEADLGADHPELGKTLHDLGNAEKHLGHYDQAAAHYRQARAIFVAAYGPEHFLVGEVDVSLAGLALEQDHDDEAEPLFARAARELAGLPADHEIRRDIEQALGSIARDRDRCGDAVPHFERARDIADRLGERGPDVASLLAALGACYDDTKRTADAAAAYARADALFAESAVDDHTRAELYILEADLASRTGDPARARQLARRVLAATTDAEGDPFKQYRAGARALLGQNGK